jgi:hypothetical protein
VSILKGEKMGEQFEINNTTGEIILSGNQETFKEIRQIKVKAFNLLNANDFVNINNVWEAKRDAMIKILSSLPISYSWELLEHRLTKEFSSVKGRLTVRTNDVTRSIDTIGTCEINELRGSKTSHIMIATSETRALKRAIDVCFGSVINYYVVNYLV